MQRKLGRVGMWMRAGGALGVLAGAAMFGCQSPPPNTPDMQVLHDAERKGDVMRFTRSAPVRCTWSRADEEVCTWHLANRDLAWWTLAPTVPTEYQVNLVCAFPVDESPRDPDACAVYPRSFMEFGQLPPVATRGGARSRQGVSERERALGSSSRDAQARRHLAHAGTVWEMTALVGDVPDHCGAVDERNTYCTWKLSKQSLGYKVVALLADSKKRVELSCTFPRDGSPRGAGTCDVRESR